MKLIFAFAILLLAGIFAFAAVRVMVEDQLLKHNLRESEDSSGE